MTIGRARVAVLVLAVACISGASHAQSSSVDGPGSSTYCDQPHPLSVRQQDVSLRFAAIVREELNAADSGAVLISRSGLDLSRFAIRYSHTAIAWRADNGAWSARQLYFACEERRPRLYDQGLAGFALGIDDPALGFVSIVRMPAPAAQAVVRAASDKPRALRLLASTYSANAYPFSQRYQNCNQWVVEMLAVAWGDIDDDADLRGRAQQWLRDAHYDPEPVDVGSPLLMFAAHFVSYLHQDDHPPADRRAMKLKISLPSTVETFVHQRQPESERVEICHDTHRIVVHRGWTSVSADCQPAEGDRVIALD